MCEEKFKDLFDDIVKYRDAEFRGQCKKICDKYGYVCKLDCETCDSKMQKKFINTYQEMMKKKTLILPLDKNDIPCQIGDFVYVDGSDQPVEVVGVSKACIFYVAVSDIGFTNSVDYVIAKKVVHK